ncbi:MAG: hypothetical protein Kow0019_19520 [Methanobacteriaceae archaeon]
MFGVSIIIPNYNGMGYLRRLFPTLSYQNNIVEIIVIDNGSVDGSVEFIKKNYPHFILIENRKNLGFASAVNQGINVSNGDYLFILNNDVEVEKDCIENLLNCIKKDEKIFAVTSKMIQYYDHTKMDDAGDEYTILGWTKRVGYGKSVELYDKERETFSACAGASLYRKSILDEIGLFDENFFAYLEDVDISYRARIHGYKCVYCPGAVVYHVGSGSSGGQYNEFKIRLAARNNVYLPYKNMPLPQFVFNLIFLLFGYLIKYMYFSIQGNGRIYSEGLKEGFNSLERIDKVSFNKENLKNYIKIEWLLIKNTFMFIFL